METLKKIQNLPCSKNDIQVFVDSTIDRIVSGELDPLEVAPYLKAMEEIVKGIRDNKDVKTALIGTLEEMDEKKVRVNGATVSIVETGRYDFSGDLPWAQLDKEIKKLTALRKQREEVLKTVPEPMDDPINRGVVMKPPPQNKTQTVRVNLR